MDMMGEIGVIEAVDTGEIRVVVGEGERAWLINSSGPESKRVD